MYDDYEMPEQAQKAANPLLQKLHRIPGTTFRLPSRGLFYKNGELDREVEDGEVIVHSMTATDELMMKNPDMLFQGTAVINVIGRCVPQILKPHELLVPDVDFLLTCLRKVSYGDSITVSHTCRGCDEPKEEDYIVPIDHFLRNTKELTEEEYKGMRITLSEMYDVRLKPCTFLEMIKILQAGDKINMDSTAEEIDGWICKSLVAVIKSVDGTVDGDHLLEWAKALPLSMRHELSDKITSLNKWGPEFKYKAKCGKCGKDTELATSINPTNFFTQSSS